MDEAERLKYRQRFAKLCRDSGYPEGVFPGTSMRNMPFKGGSILTLATDETAWSEDQHYQTLPEEPK
jgi:hypothetical protein